MTFDDLRSPWQETNASSMSAAKREEFIARVCRRVERLGATLFRRDMIETIAGIVVVLIFGRWIVSLESRVAKFGAAIVVVGACYIVYKLHRTRTSQSPSRLDASVREFCKTELQRIDQQIHLLRTVLWWYISPIIIGANLVVCGIRGVGLFSLIYLVSTLLLSWWVYTLNQKAVTKTLVPVRDALSDLLGELGEKR